MADLQPCPHVARNDRSERAFRMCSECLESAQPYIIATEGEGGMNVLYAPQPHQTRFHASTRRFCLLSGGRGSGKSLSIRWDMYMKCLTIPRFRGLILRRSFPELKMSHLDVVPFDVEQLKLPANAWHSTDYVLRFPNGSRLRFGQVENDDTLARFLSSEVEAIAFDELATFSLRQFTFLCTSLRSPIPGFVPYVRAATNPVGPGASWVKRFFIDKNPSSDEAPMYNPDDYEFIHSTMDDNPYVDRQAYEVMLSGMPSEALRAALRHGEWTIEGQMFSEWRERTPEGKPWHVFDTPPRYGDRPIWEAPHIKVVRVIDWGYAPTGNPGVCLWFALLEDGSALGFREYVFRERLPADAASDILEQSRDVRVTYTVGDTAMWQEHEGPSLAEMFARHKLPMVEADKNRVAGWVQLHTWLREVVDNGVVRRPRLSFWREGCPHTIRTIPQMLVDPKDPTDIVSVGVEDDAADCARYFVMSRPGKSTLRPATTESWIRKEMARKARRQAGLWGARSAA